MSDVIVVMRDGLIQQMGGPTDLYERPLNRFVADFIGSSNFIAGTVASLDGGDRVTIASASGLSLRGRVTDPAASLSVGDGVTVVIRPERLEVVVDHADAGSGWTAIPGRIRQGTYLGDQTEYRVHTDQAGELIVRLQNNLGASIGQGIGPGDAVTVRWKEEANLVLVD
jgi:ABC-type Fe3+/spermidine/putrescine transport system ATPase subunit